MLLSINNSWILRVEILDLDFRLNKKELGQPETTPNCRFVLGEVNTIVGFYHTQELTNDVSIKMLTRWTG